MLPWRVLEVNGSQQKQSQRSTPNLHLCAPGDRPNSGDAGMTWFCGEPSTMNAEKAAQRPALIPPAMDRRSSLPWPIAVAAINVSITGRLRPADSSPQQRAVATSIARTRWAKVVSRPSTHAPSSSAMAGVVRRFASTPLRNSPNVRTLRNNASPSAFERKAITPELARIFLVSEITLVSNK